ncbi:MAG: hypothetical protein ACRENP_29600 [Longimicrobiales bacterium]
MRIMMGLLMLAGLSASASAQRIAWDEPSFFSPRPMDDIGLYITRVNRSAGDPTGMSAIWRQSGNLNLGVRAGVGDLNNAGETVLVAAELYGPLNSLVPVGSIDVSWILAAGAVFGDSYTVFSMPLGASIGMRLGSGGVQVLPYVYPRISLDIVAFDINGEERTDTDGVLSVDIGADLSLGERLVLRVGGSLFERSAIGVGLALRWPRPVSVQ